MTPDALIFVATSCPHCPTVLDILTKALKEARIGRLEAINAAAHPGEAERYGVRSVPWVRVGPFELSGRMTPGDVTEWIDRAARGEGWAEYYAHLLEQRELDVLLAQVRARPRNLVQLLNLFADEETPLDSRVGISAVMEELAGSPLLRSISAELEQLTLAGSPHVRSDACYFLGLSGDTGAIPAVSRLLDDPDLQVREIAAETLAVLSALNAAG